MCKLLYALEDYFDALAQARIGRVSGVLSRRLSRVFAIFGDIVCVRAGFSSL
jgi:hypothetical protein